MPHGKLTVIVESATGIKDPTLHGRGGSYCTLQCGSQVLSTYISEGASSHPVFHTEFEFEIDRSTNELVISVYSKGTVRDDELVGYTSLDFKRVFYHGHTVPLTAYALSRSSGKAGGYINISLKFKSRPSPYAHNAHVPVRKHSAPPHAAPHPQTARTQHNPRGEPWRKSYPIGTENYETHEDGYGSSGSESSRSSWGSSKRSGGQYSPSAHGYRRSQSQPEQYYEDYNKPPEEDYYGTNPHNYEEAAPASYEYYAHHPRSPRHQVPQPQYNHPRPSPLAPAVPKPGPHRAAVSGGPQVAISSRPRQPIPGGPTLNFANPYPQQQPPRVTMYENPQVQVYQERRPQPQVRQQQPQVRQQQPQVRRQQPAQVQRQKVMQQQQGPSVGVQVAGQLAQVMAVEVANAGVQAVAGGIGELLGGLFG